MTESNYTTFAREELRRIRGNGPDEMQDAIEANVFKMLDVFADEGHSGFSAAYTIGILEKLLRFEPLTPLTGDDDEWTEVSDNMWQNKRCSHVFKDRADGMAYDIEGRIFTDKDGCSFTSRDSRVTVQFPYTPKREYVQVENPA